MSGQRTVRIRSRPRGRVVYRKMIRDAEPRTEAGSVVRVVDRDGAFVGQAFWNPKSELALRLLTSEEEPVGEAWFRAAVAAAVSLRRDVLRLDRFGDAWRAVFAEADRLPGLVVDRYAGVLSCHVSSLGIYRVFPVISDELKRRIGARVVHVSADPKIAKREGFPFPDSAGEAARTTIQEHGVQYEVDCARGHKTGFFLDQRDSRLRIKELAKGRRVLDLFCYTGGFALSAAAGGAKSVTAVDLDEEAIAQAGRNAERNRMDRVVTLCHADAFGFLRDLRGGEHDLIVVDPAKQAVNRKGLRKALAYYEDLNRLAFEKAAADALVLSCSCTGVVAEYEFLGALTRAAERAKRRVTFLEVRGAPPDHPVPADHPQARYLKCVLCHVK